MLCQFRDALWCAVTGQIVRGCAEIHYARRQTRRHKPRIAQPAEADREVEAFVEQIKLTVGQLDLHP